MILFSRSGSGWIAAVVLLSLSAVVVLCLLLADDQSDSEEPENNAASAGRGEPLSLYSQSQKLGDNSGVKSYRGHKLMDSEFSSPPRLSEERPGRSLPSPILSDFYFNIEGNREFSDEEIVAHLELPEGLTNNFLERLVSRQLIAFYRSRGHTGTSITSITVHGEGPTFVDVVIIEGERFHLGRVDFDGLSTPSEQEIRQFYPPSGGAFDWPRLRDADQRLAQHLEDLGFLDVEVHAQGNHDSGGNAFDYQVFVTEGNRYRVALVSAPPDFAAQVPFQQGDIFRPGLFEDFLRKAQISRQDLQLSKDPVESTVAITFH